MIPPRVCCASLGFLLLTTFAHAQVTDEKEALQSELRYAIEAKDEKRVNAAIHSGASINSLSYSSDSPLFRASSEGSANIVMRLISNGADLTASDVRGDTVLDYAARAGQIDTLILLMSVGVEFKGKSNVYGETVLHSSAGAGKAKAAELLIKKGMDVDVRDFSGQSALHFAAHEGSLETINLLISKGADVNAKDAEGDTPLHEAVNAGKLDAVALLIEKGAVASAQNISGVFPIHRAVLKGNLAIVNLLIKNGAKVNVKSNSGTTPLHGAAFSADESMVRLLIDNGATVNAKDEFGRTPLDSAAPTRLPQIMNLLMDNGAVAGPSYFIYLANRSDMEFKKQYEKILSEEIKADPEFLAAAKFAALSPKQNRKKDTHSVFEHFLLDSMRMKKRFIGDKDKVASALELSELETTEIGSLLLSLKEIAALPYIQDNPTILPAIMWAIAKGYNVSVKEAELGYQAQINKVREKDPVAISELSILLKTIGKIEASLHAPSIDSPKVSNQKSKMNSASVIGSLNSPAGPSATQAK